MIFVESGDAVIHAELIGDPEEQPVLCFVNSLGTDFRIWDQVAAHFAEDYCLLLYDKRGHGLSDLGQGPVTIDRHVDDLLALVDHFGIDRFGLVGLSIGGMIAQRLAVRAPGPARRPGALRHGRQDRRRRGLERPHRRGRGDGLDAIGDAVMERWFTPAYRAEEDMPLRVWRNMLTRQSAAGYAASCAAIRDADLTADAGEDRRADPGGGGRRRPVDPARPRPRHGRADPRRPLRRDRGRRPPALHRAPDELAALMADLLDQVTDDD